MSEIQTPVSMFLQEHDGKENPTLVVKVPGPDGIPCNVICYLFNGKLHIKIPSDTEFSLRVYNSFIKGLYERKIVVAHFAETLSVNGKQTVTVTLPLLVAEALKLSAKIHYKLGFILNLEKVSSVVLEQNNTIVLPSQSYEFALTLFGDVFPKLKNISYKSLLSKMNARNEMKEQFPVLSAPVPVLASVSAPVVAPVSAPVSAPVVAPVTIAIAQASVITKAKASSMEIIGKIVDQNPGTNTPEEVLTADLSVPAAASPVPAASVPVPAAAPASVPVPVSVPMNAEKSTYNTLANQGYPCIVDEKAGLMFNGPQACVVIIDGIAYPVSYVPYALINGVEYPVCLPVQKM